MERLCYFMIILCVYLFIKNLWTYHVRSKIATAIYQYQINNPIQYNYYVTYDLEYYNKTLFRLWDWGYKRIVPKEIYDRIKDYIK